MQAKFYVARLTLNGKEIHRFVGRRGETPEQIRESILESLGITMTEMSIDADPELMTELINVKNGAN